MEVVFLWVKYYRAGLPKYQASLECLIIILFCGICKQLAHKIIGYKSLQVC